VGTPTVPIIPAPPFACPLPPSMAQQDDIAIDVDTPSPSFPPLPPPADKSKGDLDRANRLLKVAKTSIDDLKQQLVHRAEEHEKLKNEFQRYRVKAEVAKTQSTSEIARLAEINLKYKQFNVSSGDVANELEACRRRIEGLEEQRAVNESENRRLAHALAVTASELETVTVQRDEWRRKAEVVGPQVLHNKTHALERDLAEIRVEADSYKEICEKALKEKDEALRQLGRLTETRHDNVDLAYLRDIILKYLMTQDEKSRSAIETAITTVLRFTPDEQEKIRLARGGWRAAIGL